MPGQDRSNPPSNIGRAPTSASGKMTPTKFGPASATFPESSTGFRQVAPISPGTTWAGTSACIPRAGGASIRDEGRRSAPSRSLKGPGRLGAQSINSLRRRSSESAAFPNGNGQSWRTTSPRLLPSLGTIASEGAPELASMILAMARGWALRGLGRSLDPGPPVRRCRSLAHMRTISATRTMRRDTTAPWVPRAPSPVLGSIMICTVLPDQRSLPLPMDQIGSRLDRIGSTSAQILSELSRIWPIPMLAEIAPKSGQLWTKIGPNVANAGPDLANVDRSWRNHDRNRQKCASLRSKFGRLRHRSPPNVANVCPMSTEFDRFRPEFGRIRSGLERF